MLVTRYQAMRIWKSWGKKDFPPEPRENLALLSIESWLLNDGIFMSIMVYEIIPT